MQRISIQLAVSKLVLNHHVISRFVHDDQLCDTVIFVVFNPLKPFILGRENVSVSHMSDSFIFCFSKNQIKFN